MHILVGSGLVLSGTAPSVAGMAQTSRTARPSLVSTRIITADVPRLTAFYEAVTGIDAVWSTPDFVELRTPVGTLAIGSARTVALFGEGSARPADNHTAIIEFLVEDVDADYRRLQPAAPQLVCEPTTMPWGNRSLLLRDPDGTLVNLFTPVTAEARTRAGL